MKRKRARTNPHKPHPAARFQREAKVLVQLNHPNIASVYDFDQFEGQWYLVLEMIEGEDLSKRLKGGPLPVEDALDLCKQIAEALEAMESTVRGLPEISGQ